MEFNINDKVQLKEETKRSHKQTKKGRLLYGKVYNVLKVTKQGHLLLQTEWGKTFYSKEKFNKCA